jgi:hypothetical protein
MTKVSAATDFFILGPAMVRGNRVLEAVHALYYLPENYKLIFSDAQPMDQELVMEVKDLAQRNELGQRVHFNSDAKPSSAIIASKGLAMPTNNVVSGDTPEALASAILAISRAR